MMIEVIVFLEYSQLNEMSDDVFDAIKNAGNKLGIRVRKVDSFFDYLKKANKGLNDIARYAGIYLSTDIKNKKTRQEMVKLSKDTLKRINKQEVVDFLLQLDKNTTHLTTIFRHFFQSVLGVEFTTYHEWESDLKFLQTYSSDMRKVLVKLKADKQLKLLDNFIKSVKTLEV